MVVGTDEVIPFQPIRWPGGNIQRRTISIERVCTEGTMAYVRGCTPEGRFPVKRIGSCRQEPTKSGARNRSAVVRVFEVLHVDTLRWFHEALVTYPAAPSSRPSSSSPARCSSPAGSAGSPPHVLPCQQASSAAAVLSSLALGAAATQQSRSSPLSHLLSLGPSAPSPLSGSGPGCLTIAPPTSTQLPPPLSLAESEARPVSSTPVSVATSPYGACCPPPQPAAQTYPITVSVQQQQEPAHAMLRLATPAAVQQQQQQCCLSPSSSPLSSSSAIPFSSPLAATLSYSAARLGSTFAQWAASATAGSPLPLPLVLYLYELFPSNHMALVAQMQAASDASAAWTALQYSVRATHGEALLAVVRFGAAREYLHLALRNKQPVDRLSPLFESLWTSTVAAKSSLSDEYWGRLQSFCASWSGCPAAALEALDSEVLDAGCL